MKRILISLVFIGFIVNCQAQGCQAYFTYSSQGTTYLFYDSSYGYSGNHWYWTFGDGSNSTSQNPQHSYNSNGVYQVCLSIYDSLSNCYNQYCDSIQVGSGHSCQAGFNYSKQGLSVSFTNASQYYSGSYYHWSFGDNSGASGQNVTHTYNATGWYTVCLNIQDSTISCYDQYCDSIYVSSGHSCQALFTYSISGTTVTFYDSSLNYSGNNQHWTFGDNSSGTGQTVHHTYNSHGVYYVCLTIYNSATNCYNQYCDSVLVGSGSQCHAAFTYTMQGTTLVLTNTSQHYSGNYSYWTFGDGGHGTGQTVSHTFVQSGWYTVCLNIHDSATACYDQYCDSIHVGSGHACQAAFTYTMQGTTLTFADASQNYSGSYWFWNFGDGSNGTGRNVTKTYNHAGWYKVCLNIYDSSTACYDQYCDSIHVGSGHACQAYFTYIIQGTTVTFTDSSLNYSGQVWVWDFGDGSSGTGQNIHHSYNAYGWYKVCLTIHDAATNCYNQYCDSIYLHGGGHGCQAYFTYSSQGKTFTFYDSSTNYSGNYRFWVFGDNTTGTGQTVHHTYYHSGHYLVCLTIRNSATGCNDHYCDSVTVIINSINPTVSQIHSARIYPNPIEENLTIDMDVLHSMDIQIEIYNQIGQNIYHIKKTLDSGTQKLTIDASSFPKGIYNLQIISSEGVIQTGKFVKIE